MTRACECPVSVYGASSHFEGRRHELVIFWDLELVTRVQTPETGRVQTPETVVTGLIVQLEAERGQLEAEIGQLEAEMWQIEAEIGQREDQIGKLE